MSREPRPTPNMRWKPRCARLPSWPPRASSDFVERARERRLAVGGLVLVDHALAGRLVQLAAGRHQQLAGLFLVAGLDGLAEPAHRRMKRRLHRLVAQSASLVGLDAL